MTKRNPDIEGIPTVVSFVADSESLKTFKDMVGDQNFSKEIRAMIKDRVKLEKNEQALPKVDPLNLARDTTNPLMKSTDYRQSTLFETFARKDKRDEICSYIQSVKDPRALNQLEQNARCMLAVSQVRRKKLVYS